MRRTLRVSRRPSRFLPRVPRVMKSGPATGPRCFQVPASASTTGADSGTSSFSRRPLPLIEVFPAIEIGLVHVQPTKLRDAQADAKERENDCVFAVSAISHRCILLSERRALPHSAFRSARLETHLTRLGCGYPLANERLTARRNPAARRGRPHPVYLARNHTPDAAGRSLSNPPFRTKDTQGPDCRAFFVLLVAIPFRAAGVSTLARRARQRRTARRAACSSSSAMRVRDLIFSGV